MPGQTTKQSLIMRADADVEAGIRESARQQGCLCGDQLVVEKRELSGRELERHRERFGNDVPASGWRIGHHPACPLLAKLERRN